MTELTPRSRGRFERETTESLVRIKKILREMLAELGVRRQVELQRMLKIDVTLSWQIFKVVDEKSKLGAGAVMPSRTSIERFGRLAGQNGVGADRIASLLEAYERFEAAIERHAGDRASFISLVTAAEGLNDKWLAADLQHRRNMYRGMSHVIGVQAQSRVGAYLISRAAGDNTGFQLASVNGYIGLRTLRNVDLIPVHGSRITTPGIKRPGKKMFLGMQRLQLDIVGRNSALEEYCSQPLPSIQVSSRKATKENSVQMSLVRPEVGNLGVVTVFFGEKFWFKEDLTSLNMVTRLPTEELIQDLIVPRGLITGQPMLEVFLGDDRPDGLTDLMPIAGGHEFCCLGVGRDVLTIPNMPRYGDMIASMAASSSIALDDCEVWRVRLKFPIYQSTSRITWQNTA